MTLDVGGLKHKLAHSIASRFEPRPAIHSPSWSEINSIGIVSIIVLPAAIAILFLATTDKTGLNSDKAGGLDGQT